MVFNRRSVTWCRKNDECVYLRFECPKSEWLRQSVCFRRDRCHYEHIGSQISARTWKKDLYQPFVKWQIDNRGVRGWNSATRYRIYQRRYFLYFHRKYGNSQWRRHANPYSDQLEQMRFCICIYFGELQEKWNLPEWNGRRMGKGVESEVICDTACYISTIRMVNGNKTRSEEHTSELQSQR